MDEVKQIKNASYEGKKVFKLPPGVTVTDKRVSINVEEIENGFLICKSYDIKWTKESDDGDVNTGYEYYSKKWFSKTNPINIEDEDDEMSLADKFE